MHTDVLSTPPAIEAIALESYVKLDAKIDGDESDAIETGWEYGQLLLHDRVGKKLPTGRLAQIARETKKELTDGFVREMQRRMKLVSLYPTRTKLRHACRNAPSWYDLVISMTSSGVHFSSDTSEWCTPTELVAKVVEVLGEIDLDPCADSKHRVPAKAHYTQKQNGLSRGWAGKVYMNPPYGRELPDWIEKLRHEYSARGVTEAIALVPARTDTEWFNALRDFPRCFIRGRLKFSESENSAPFPSMVVYLGSLRPTLPVFRPRIERARVAAIGRREPLAIDPLHAHKLCSRGGSPGA